LLIFKVETIILLGYQINEKIYYKTIKKKEKKLIYLRIFVLLLLKSVFEEHLSTSRSHACGIHVFLNFWSHIFTSWFWVALVPLHLIKLFGCYINITTLKNKSSRTIYTIDIYVKRYKNTS
jgi:hypothetical protein